MPHTVPASPGFADQASRGRNNWWRYIVAAMFFTGGAYGLIRFVGAPVFLFMSRVGFAPAREPAATIAFYAFLYALLLGLMLTVFPLAHDRPWLSFVTARPRPAFGLFTRSFAVMLALCLVTLMADLYFTPSALSFTDAPMRVLRLAPAVLCFLPVQCLAEEVLFRGYLAQAVGRLTGLAVLRIGVPALLFGVAHFSNPEMGQDRLWMGAGYVLAGLYLGLASLRGRGLEASFGIHLANNLSASLIVGVPQKALPVMTLWTDNAPDARLGFVFDLALYGVHYCLVFKPWRLAAAGDIGKSHKDSRA